jgi:phosphoribosylglycinamide formyltransferase-1
LKNPLNIAVFASGNGSNAENLTRYFHSHPYARVRLLVVNNQKAGAIPKLKALGIPVFVFSNSDIQNGSALIDLLEKNEVSLILLAGFLRKIPDNLLQHFPQRIINIHPSLLPKHGGLGMYGIKVHQAVIQAKDLESGATVHLVNGEYDQGDILLAEPCPVLSSDTPETLASRIHEIEHRIFPRAVENYIFHKLNPS